MRLHGSSVAFLTEAGAVGLLIVGKSGSGKSELALELMGLGARLVSDDQTELRREGETLYMAAPARLRGLIELRGLGIVRADPLDDVPLAVVVDLDEVETLRLPERHNITLLGLEITRLRYCTSKVFAVGLKHYVLSRHWLDKEI
jgi:HPr kinase/phosphorylase